MPHGSATGLPIDFSALDDLLADNATLISPMVHTPQVGKLLAMGKPKA